MQKMQGNPAKTEKMAVKMQVENQNLHFDRRKKNIVLHKRTLWPWVIGYAPTSRLSNRCFNKDFAGAATWGGPGS